MLDQPRATWDNSAVTSKRARARLAAVLLLALAVTACSGGGGDDDAVEPTASQPTGGSPAPSGTTSPPTSTASPAPAESDAPAGAETPFPADRSPDTSPAERTGNGLTVVDVRVGAHEGYDRLVLELDGEGTVGWRVAYDSDPRTQGEGAEVQLEGDATLAVVLDGLGYPFDTGIEEYGGPRRFSPGLPAVREVQLGGVYEGYYEAFVGVASEQPFRVFRLAEPQRVVVDVARAG